jgi:AraC family transcriptional regulator
MKVEFISRDHDRMCEVFTRVVSLLASASRELDQSEAAARSSIDQAATLLQAQIRHGRIGPQEPSQALLAWEMRLVERYIEQHIDQQIRVANLSALIDLSEAHFSRAFRLAYGEPPHAHIVRRRVTLAAQLMLSGREPLSEIALKCGFHDQAHLSKQFRQQTGETPAAWRRLRRRPAGVEFASPSQMIPNTSPRATA